MGMATDTAQRQAATLLSLSLTELGRQAPDPAQELQQLQQRMQPQISQHAYQWQLQQQEQHRQRRQSPWELPNAHQKRPLQESALTMDSANRCATPSVSPVVDRSERQRAAERRQERERQQGEERRQAEERKQAQLPVEHMTLLPRYSPPSSSKRKEHLLSSLLWSYRVSDQHVRLAARRDNEAHNVLLVENAADGQPDSPHRQAHIRRMQQQLRLGAPVIVTNCPQRMNWGPDCMCRAIKELKDSTLEVVDCSRGGTLMTFQRFQFFKGYRTGVSNVHKHNALRDAEGSLRMLKIKDFPRSSEFSKELPRHHKDFCESLPLIEMTHPTAGPLNLAASLPANTLRPDLGPKSYIAYGRTKEGTGEGDSVTKLHCDMSDAVNILQHQQNQPSDPPWTPRCGREDDCRSSPPLYGGAGAVWDIWRREDLKALRGYLTSHASEFQHCGQPVCMATLDDVIHSQVFYLTDSHRAALRAETGVEAWHFEQHEGEAVYIPAGCAHQVRNLRPCIKVAIDFVAPESVEECLKLAAQFRKLCMRPHHSTVPAADRHFADKLQVTQMVFSSVTRAVDRLLARQV